MCIIWRHLKLSLYFFSSLCYWLVWLLKEYRRWSKVFYYMLALGHFNTHTVFLYKMTIIINVASDQIIISFCLQLLNPSLIYMLKIFNIYICCHMNLVKVWKIIHHNWYHLIIYWIFKFDHMCYFTKKHKINMHWTSN